MRISIDISMYPLNENYKKPINDFITKLAEIPGADVDVNPMSTQIRGEHDIIFDYLKNEIPNVFEENRAAFVMKVIKGSD